MTIWQRAAEWLILRLGGAVLQKLDEQLEDTQPSMPLSHKHSERQAKAAREAGREKP
jgi:hypothetical protein